MNLNRLRYAAAWTAGLALTAGLAGCRVQVNKGANGQDKSVQVDTPFGGMHVDTNQTTAADVGLPVYPGAVEAQDKDNKSADVHMGFGAWQMRVKVVSYQTPDSTAKVTAFYRDAMGRYGKVITCRNNAPVGAPAATGEGLTCAGDNNNGGNDNGLELKAGSKRHQHIVGFQNPRDGQTRFSLVDLDLPAIVDSSSGKSD